MPVEFDCVHCRARLRIPEEVLGQKTQCPYCQEIQIVAHAAQNGSTDAGVNAVEPGKLAPSRVPFTILYEAWMIFCARIGSFLILGLIAFGINVLAILLFLLALYIESLEKHGLEPHASTIACIFCYVFWLLGNILLFLGGIRYSLHLVRSGQRRLSLLIPRAKEFFSFSWSCRTIPTLCRIIGATAIPFSRHGGENVKTGKKEKVQSRQLEGI